MLAAPSGVGLNVLEGRRWCCCRARCTCDRGNDVELAVKAAASSMRLTVLLLWPVWLALASMMLTVGAAGAQGRRRWR